MSKILNDAELAEIRDKLFGYLVAIQGECEAANEHSEIDLCLALPDKVGTAIIRISVMAGNLFDHIDALAASLDAEAAAHSVTRAALVASPEYIYIDDYNSGESWLECAHCHYTLLDGHANDCLLKVALEQAP